LDHSFAFWLEMDLEAMFDPTDLGCYDICMPFGRGFPVVHSSGLLAFSRRVAEVDKNTPLTSL